MSLLSDLALENNKIKHPNFPDHMRPRKKFSDKDETALENCIIFFITYYGGQCEPIKVKATRSDKRIHYIDSVGYKRTIGRVQYMKSRMQAGSADLSSTIPVKIEGKDGKIHEHGLSVKIEVKIGKDWQKDVQKEYQSEIESASGLYWIVKNFEDFYIKYCELTGMKSVL